MTAGFGRLLRAEWTKLRSVRGWAGGGAAAALMVVLFAILTGFSATGSGAQSVPLGPDGRPVVDSFSFVHRPLAGDGSITVAVASLSTVDGAPVPWAKAGLLLKASLEPGSQYAAVLVTGGHGARMQHDFVHDRAAPDPAARWLRLTRTGDSVRGEASVDGRLWSVIGTARLAGLPATVHVGLFVACPQYVAGHDARPDAATAVFGRPELDGAWPDATWSGVQVGEGTATTSGYPAVGDVHGPRLSGAVIQNGDGYTVTGAGDIAPATRGDLPTGGVLGELLFGTFPALIAVGVVAALSATSEYRQGLVHLTLTASPGRVRVLAAKALVLGAAAFLVSLPAVALAIPIGSRIARAHGIYLFPFTSFDVVRVAAGTAGLLALTAVLALGVGTALRRGAPAVTTVVLALVLPHLLVLTPLLPGGLQRAVTRWTPDAAFAVQQTLVQYPQVESVYTPSAGYYPLGAGAGLGVLAGYAAAALLVAAARLRWSDA